MKCGFTTPCANCKYIKDTKPKPLKFSPNIEEVGLGNKWMDWYDKYGKHRRKTRD